MVNPRLTQFENYNSYFITLNNLRLSSLKSPFAICSFTQQTVAIKGSDNIFFKCYLYWVHHNTIPVVISILNSFLDKHIFETIPPFIYKAKHFSTIWHALLKTKGKKIKYMESGHCGKRRFSVKEVTSIYGKLFLRGCHSGWNFYIFIIIFCFLLAPPLFSLHSQIARTKDLAVFVYTFATSSIILFEELWGINVFLYHFFALLFYEETCLFR